MTTWAHTSKSWTGGCTVDLGIMPVQKGQFPLIVSVLERVVADRDGVHLLPPREYETPYRLKGTVAVRGVGLRWRVRITP